MYLENLCDQIKSDYDSISKNVRLFSKKGRVIAEIDILAIKEDTYDIYEVKCSHRITKARKQLYKIKRLMPHISNMFFFCGSSGLLKRME